MRTSPDLPPLIERTVQRLIRAFAPERIILFGSQAKGRAGTRSDFDLLVVAALDGNHQLHLRRARQLAADCFPPVDVVLATPAEVADPAAIRSPFLASILDSGVLLYESSSSKLSASVGQAPTSPRSSPSGSGSTSPV